MRVKDFLSHHKASNKLAIKHGDNQITYKDLHNRCTVLALRLQRDFPKARHVAIYLPNCIEYVIAYFSILYAGKTVVPISAQAKEREVAYCLEQCDCELLLTDDRNSKHINGLNELASRVLVDSAELIPEGTHHIVSVCNEVAVLLGTSGTTNRPKRVMLTDENIASNIEAFLHLVSLAQNDVPLVTLPFTSSYGHTIQMLVYIYLGVTFVIMKDFFTVSNFFRVINKDSITYFEAVPSLLAMLAKAAQINTLNNVWGIGYGGACMPKHVLESLMTAYPHIKFLQGYGQTEASPLIAKMDMDNYLAKKYSVGRPLTGVDVLIANGNKHCEVNEVGEIFAFGPNIMLGYYKNPEETKERVTDGYLKTGDFGWLDKDGYLFITGRQDALIISGGMNISPEEIEEVLIQHPIIQDAYVYAEHDDTLGEVVVADIVCSTAVDENDVLKFCNKLLSSYKVPRHLYFTNSIRKSDTGKNIRCRK